MEISQIYYSTDQSESVECAVKCELGHVASPIFWVISIIYIYTKFQVFLTSKTEWAENGTL